MKNKANFKNFSLIAAMFFVAVFGFSNQARAGVIFEDNFDSQADWSPTQPVGGGQQNVCQPYSCASTNSMTPSWTAYYIGGSYYSNAGHNTLNIDSTNHRGSSGKAFTHYSETCDTCGWSTNGGLMKQFSVNGEPEIYLRYYKKFQPSWVWAAYPAEPQIKMTHIYSYWGYDSAFSFLNPPIRTAPLVIDKMNIWRSVNDKITSVSVSHYDGSDAEILASHSAPDNSPGSKYFPKPGGGDCVWNEIGCPGDGDWHSYQYYLKANSTVGASDGEYKFWYDGQLILNKTGIRWATASASTNPRHLWNAFTFGANNYNKFAPQSSELEQWYAIDDVVVSTNYIPDNYVIGGGTTQPQSDTTSPSVPANLTATAISTSQINLSWSSSADNIGVIEYKIYRNGSLLTTQNSSLTTYSNTGLTANTAYTYKVSAIDAAGNESAQSSVANAATQSGQLPANNILQSSDLQYLGVIAPPIYSGYNKYARGMNRCNYVPSNLCNFGGNSDPSPNDGFPGCLMCNSHPSSDLIGVFEIKPPIIVNSSNRTSSYWSNNLPHGQQVLQFMDCTGGILAQYGGPGGSWDVASALILPNGDGLCQFYDWYNTGKNDNPSAVWFTPNSNATNIQGPYNFGPMNDPIFHANKNSANLGLIPKAFSSAYLGGNGHQYCYSGYNRGGSGGQESSPGPTLYAFDCESRPSVSQPGPLTATPLLYYNTVQNSYDNIPLMPEHTPKDVCDDLVWIDYQGKRGVLAACLKGGPYWWYGMDNPATDPAAHRNQCQWNAGNPIWGSQGKNPGASCSIEFFSWGPSLAGISDNSGGKGYHAIFNSLPYEKAQLVFYDEDELIEVAQGIRQPTNVSRSVVLDNPSELWDVDGNFKFNYGGIAFDDVNGLIYIVQEGGVKDNPVVHVYKINSGVTPSTPDTTSPSVPANLTAAAVSSNRINLAWTANAESDLNGYKIYRDDGQAFVIAKPNTSYADNDLIPGITYGYRISAYDTAGNESEKSSSVSATVKITYGIADFINLLSDWLQTVSSLADVNSDGVVNSRDLGIMMSNWN